MFKYYAYCIQILQKSGSNADEKKVKFVGENRIRANGRPETTHCAKPRQQGAAASSLKLEMFGRIKVILARIAAPAVSLSESLFT